MRRREPINVVFGRRLKKLRQAHGMTQERLGTAAKVGYKHLGEMERGEASPSFEVVERIADVLGVDYATFFLPDTLGTTDLAEQVRRLADDANHLDPASVRLFLADLAESIQKLARGRAQGTGEPKVTSRRRP